MKIIGAGLLDGFEAIVDYPGSYFYQEIMAAYPDAKVVLTVRDGESSERSLHDTIWGAIYGDTLMHHIAMAQATIDPAFMQFVRLLRTLYSTCGLFPGDPRAPGRRPVGGGVRRPSRRAGPLAAGHR
jgi:hypothetical protein